jgi:hypothetical protein
VRRDRARLERILGEVEPVRNLRVGEPALERRHVVVHERAQAHLLPLERDRRERHRGLPARDSNTASPRARFATFRAPRRGER